MYPIGDSQLIPGLDLSYLKLLGLRKLVDVFRATGEVTITLRVHFLVALLIGGPFILFQVISPLFIEVDLEKAIVLTLNSVSFAQMFVKPGLFWLNIKHQVVLFELMTSDLLSSIPVYKRARAQQIYQRIVKISNTFCYIVLFFTAANILAMTVFPGIRSEYIAFHVGKMEEVTTGPKKVLGGWYPVPFCDSPWAEVVYAVECFQLFWCGLMVSLYELTITQQVMSLYAHQSVLCYHLSTLNKEEIVSHSSKQGVTDRQAEELLYQALLEIIRDHQKLLRYGKVLNDSYSSYTTMLLATGGIILIITIFQFAFGGKDVLTSLKFMLYLSFEALEFIFLCYGTTMLETTSTDMEFAIYNSEWYTSHKKLRNTALMLMVRSEKPVSLVAFRMYPVNVETLMKIFRFTYTASTLLSSMLEPKI